MSKTQTIEDTQDGRPNLAGKLFNVFSYVATVAVGAKVAKTASKHAFFEKYKDIPEMFITEAREARRVYRRDMVNAHARSLGLPELSAEDFERIDKCGPEAKPRFADMPGLKKVLHQVQIKFDGHLDDLYKKNGFTNTFDFLKALDGHKKTEVGERAFTAAGITGRAAHYGQQQKPQPVSDASGKEGAFLLPATSPLTQLFTADCSAYLRQCSR